VEAGESISLSRAGANRDPEQFPDPDEFDLDRESNRHMTFTVGVHRCIGSHIARMEMHVAFEEIPHRLPDYQLVDEIRVAFTPGAREDD
jgi:cytochrome P450